MKKLWSGRFKEETKKIVDDFNASLPFDRELWNEDIKGSIEHAKMLFEIKLLTKSELDSIISGLLKIKNDIENNNFVFEGEDIHMAIEAKLTQDIGEAGKKLHTARSRNDQVATDFKLYILKSNKIIQKLLINVIQTLLNIAKIHKKTLMPGMTHLQHAQPISLSFHLLAWATSFERDLQRLKHSNERANDCPLGCAAFAGTPYKNEREKLARNLGFEKASINAMESISSRDFALDFGYDLSVIMLHISRISEELILWNSYEFGFISFSDSFCTGSSIMPQKKNPDVVELLRAKSGRIFGNLFSLLTILKGLPMAYNKDMQEDKEGIFDSFKNVKISLEILNEVLKNIQFKKENMLKMCQIGHLVATDLADYLVTNHNVPFREAHNITGICVKFAEEQNIDLSLIDPFKLKLFLKETKNLDINLDSLKECLDLENCMEKRNSLGGTSSIQVEHQIEILKKIIKD